jgi:hypothetical protein
MKKLIIVLLPFILSFSTIAQRDSIVHDSLINISLSDIAKRYITFYPGFEFNATTSISLQSRIFDNSEKISLALRKFGNLKREFIHQNGKLRKIILSDLSGNISAYDTLYYNGDTLKRFVNHIISGNVQREYIFDYSNSSIYPIKLTRTWLPVPVYNFLTFNNDGLLLEDIYGQSINPSAQRKIFTYNSDGNLTNIQYVNSFYQQIVIQEHDTSFGLYSNSLPLKLWAYSRGFSDYIFSKNNPLKYSKTLNGNIIIGKFTFQYNTKSYPRNYLETDNTGFNNFEEFEYN